MHASIKRRQAKPSSRRGGSTRGGHRSSRRNVVSVRAPTHARRRASQPHTQAHRRSLRTANDDGRPIILGRGTDRSQGGEKNRHQREDRADELRAAEQQRGSACGTTAPGRTTRRPMRDTKRPTGGTGRLTPRYPRPPASRRREERSKSAQPPHPPRRKNSLPASRSSGARRPKTMTQARTKSPQTQKRTIIKVPGN